MLYILRFIILFHKIVKINININIYSYSIFYLMFAHYDCRQKIELLNSINNYLDFEMAA